MYEIFLERKVKEVTSQAVSAATGISRENVEGAMGISRQNSTTATKRNGPNGKMKNLWDHANDNNQPDPSRSSNGLSSVLNVFNKFLSPSESSDHNQANLLVNNNLKSGSSGKRRKSRRKV